ncbi:hypothetical protein VARIO8X_100010 [Burkholderiales bacterium 8X]|nr:hypothetical protein VARIO8X_100010 [Burkholderiales bacterium 8X]
MLLFSRQKVALLSLSLRVASQTLFVNATFALFGFPSMWPKRAAKLPGGPHGSSSARSF